MYSQYKNSLVSSQSIKYLPQRVRVIIIIITKHSHYYWSRRLKKKFKSLYSYEHIQYFFEIITTRVLHGIVIVFKCFVWNTHFDMYQLWLVIFFFNNNLLICYKGNITYYYIKIKLFTNLNIRISFSGTTRLEGGCVYKSYRNIRCFFIRPT